MSKRRRSVANPELGQREYADALKTFLSAKVVETFAKNKMAQE
jgi:hypothetical protein